MRVHILGGGIIGASIAYHLTRTPGIEVQVFEKDRLLSQSSFARSCGGLRSQYSTATNIQMSRYSIDFIKNIPGLKFTGNGYLMLFGADQAQDCRSSFRLQKKHGASTRCLRPDQLKTLHDYLNVDDVWRGCQTFDQSEGWIDPTTLHSWFVTEARAAGANWNWLDGLQADHDHADAIVLASGCWTGQVGRHFGLDIPVAGHKHTVFHVSSPAQHIPSLPVVADLITGIYIRPEGNQYIVGYDGNGTWSAPDLEPDLQSWDRVWELLYHRFPGIFEAARCQGAWSGYYDSSTIDNNAIIDKRGNIYFATGFTGRGLMHSPAVGHQVSLMIQDQPTLDLSAYELNRKPDIEKYVI